MSRQLSLLGAAFVIGRRDYTATVFSRSFLFFLLGPLFPILLGVLFGGLGAKVASQAEQERVAVIASAADYGRLERSWKELSELPGFGRMPRLTRAAPGVAAPGLLKAEKPAIVAVLSDPFGTPRLTGTLRDRDPLIGDLKLVLARASGSGGELPAVAVERVAATAGSIKTARSTTARGAQALLFVLTLMLATMLLSQLIEEKSSKVIEVLAAAVRVQSIFIGKLFAMLAMSLTGIIVWVSLAVVAVLLFAPAGVLAALPAPAVGWIPFAILGAAYFAMSYLLIGAAFLGIGAQATTVREVQTLSMPVTMAQVALFALASVAISDPNGPGGIAAAVFPLSSPFTMMARAALEPALWPHLVALLWQALWVSLILMVAAAWFRRAVLSGAGEKKRWWKRRAVADLPV